MSTDFKSPSFKKLLDSLQQQSWELELIISGFAIFGLFTAYEPLRIEMNNAQNEQLIYRFVIFFILHIACSILLFNLLLHVILRGLWIGALGLRYVSGDIEFEKLGYTARFKNYLQKRIVSFDRYIANLENYCSVLFAISFLLIFYVLALTMVILSIVIVATYLIDNESLPKTPRSIIGGFMIFFIIMGMFLTFFDFITQGLLKKNKWVAKVYFPFYWVFSFLTLSFLYRPLVYNFLDNRFGKRLIFILIPIYLGILVLTTFEYRRSNYFKESLDSSEWSAGKENYLDLMVDGSDFIEDVAIPSKVVDKNYLQVFIPFSEKIENRIFAHEESLKPEKDLRGLSSSLNITTSWKDELKWVTSRDSIRSAYVQVFNKVHSLKIDTLKMESEFIITTNKKGALGFETYLNLKDLDEGKHLLKVMRLRKKKDTVYSIVDNSIPFWYFKN